MSYKLYSHVSEVRLHLHTHIHIHHFAKPGPSRLRPFFDPMPQLIKAYSTRIPQYFSYVTLSSISEPYLSFSPAISHFLLYPFILLSLWLSSFFLPHFLFLLILCLFHIISISSLSLSVSVVFVPSISLGFFGIKKKHTHTQLRHQSLQWPSFRLEPYLKLKWIPPPPKCSCCPFLCLLIIVVKCVCNVMLFGMGSPCYC